jgi:hypothetical protein
MKELKAMNRIVLYKDMTDGARKPYRIAEIFESIDGYRTRVTSHCFVTEAEANAAIRSIKNKNQEEL